MDPYLEAAWSDVHAKLIAFIPEVIAPQLPPGLRIRSEEDLSVESDDPGDPTSLRPDAVVKRETWAGGGAGATVATTNVAIMPSGRAAQPVRVHLDRDPKPDKRVVILDGKNGNRIITAIEVLSPVNKAPGKGNRKYLRKLEMYRSGGVSVVEIDLLRDPPRDRLEVNQFHLPPGSRTAYLAGVCRAREPDDWDIFPISIRDSIPGISIPLRPGEPEAVLELQPLIERIYAIGGYFETIDYSRPCNPPLDPADAAWAAHLLKQANP